MRHSVRDSGAMVAIENREDVVLRDGSTLRLRPTTPADAGALVEFFERLTPESRYLRFQGARQRRCAPGRVLSAERR